MFVKLYVQFFSPVEYIHDFEPQRQTYPEKGLRNTVTISVSVLIKPGDLLYPFLLPK